MLSEAKHHLALIVVLALFVLRKMILRFAQDDSGVMSCRATPVM